MKTAYQIHIIIRLKRLREELGYSQGDIATLLGISHGHIGNIESSKTPHKYTLAQIYTLCREFKTSIGELFLDQEVNPADTINPIIQKIIEYEQ